MYNRRVRRRWIAISILAVIFAAAIAAAWLWWRSTAPRVARLLPEAEGYFYIDLVTLRRAGAINQLPPVGEDPEYRDFIQATDFRFERDLNAAAFAIHGQIGFDPAALEGLRFSEVFNVNIDRQRATAFLRGIAQKTATYREREIFYIPHQGRTVRATFLDDHDVAVSNADSDAPLHAIVDKFTERTLASPAPMLREFYGEVPFGSLVWLIARINPAAAEPRGALITSELGRMLGGSTMIASARFITSLNLCIEAIAPTEVQAGEIGQNAGAFLQLYGLAEQQAEPGGADPDIKAALKSLQVEQQGKRVILTADIPARMLRKLAQQPTNQTQ
jgi:hypothetical protein